MEQLISTAEAQSSQNSEHSFAKLFYPRAPRLGGE
jgi:hypothetical protein